MVTVEPGSAVPVNVGVESFVISSELTPESENVARSGVEGGGGTTAEYALKTKSNEVVGLPTPFMASPAAYGPTPLTAFADHPKT